MDYADMIESLIARETAPLPRAPLRDLHHWRAETPSDLHEKNSAAIGHYHYRAGVAGVYRDQLAHAARVASGLVARHWMLGRAA